MTARWAALIAITLAAGASVFGGGAAWGHELIPVKREILALYDGAREGSVDATRIHRFAELPLNHLGFIVRFHDVGDGMPELSQMERYRGVLTWFAGPVPDGARYLAWAAQASRMNLHYVALGEVGAEVTPGNLQLVNLLLGAIGLRHSGDFVSPTRGARVVARDPGMIGFECKLDPVLPEFPIIDVVGADVKAALSLEAPAHEGRLPATVVAVSGKGGFAALNYEFCHQRAPLHQGRWLLDPFAFFRSAFGGESFPIPDTTTVSGRRLYYSLVSSEGWSSQSEIERYRQSGSIAAEAVLRELVEPFPDLPVTLDLHEGDLETYPKSARQARQTAERFLSLGRVERPSRHSLGSLLSRFDSRYPSISSLAALASAGPENVYYTATANETAYAEQGQVGAFGFHSLKETLQNTERPRRLKGFNLNYHVYSGQYPALLQSVKGHLELARAERLAPIASGRYAGIVEGFFAAIIERTGGSSWQIRNRGALQTVRFDDADGLEIDLQTSIGVLGQTRHLSSLYVALDEAIEPAIIVLKRAEPAYRPPAVLSLVDSRWLVRNLVRSECAFAVEGQGYGPGEFRWSGVSPGGYRVVAERQGQALWSGTAMAGANGELAFSVPVDAIEPVTIRAGSLRAQAGCEAGGR